MSIACLIRLNGPEFMACLKNTSASFLASLCVNAIILAPRGWLTITITAKPRKDSSQSIRTQEYRQNPSQKDVQPRHRALYRMAHPDARHHLRQVSRSNGERVLRRTLAGIGEVICAAPEGRQLIGDDATGDEE